MKTYRSLFVTIKPTLSCNLACTYCYGRENHSVGRTMDDNQIKKALQWVSDVAVLMNTTHVELCWHGGEPFLLGPIRLEALLEYASNLFAQKGLKIVHSVQTNGVLLTPDFYPIIGKYFNNSVGISLDLFSSQRVFRNGSVSSEIVINNIQHALKAGVTCGVINLLTKQNVGRIDDIYRFYRDHNINVRLARVFPITPDFNPRDIMYLDDEEYSAAMNRYFDLWVNDLKPARNNDIIKLIGDLLLGRPSVCLREKACYERYIALAPDGAVYSCAEFDVPESEIGNFLIDSPEDFIKSNARERLAEKAVIPDECHDCRYYKTCYGGCFRERFILKYPYRCKANILYWNHIVTWLESKGCSLYMLEGKSREESIEVLSKLFK